MKELKVKSSAFEHNGLIPKKYSSDGEDVMPPLTIEDIPDGTQGLASVVDDLTRPWKRGTAGLPGVSCLPRKYE